ncbi:hypothetical protein [uncultured Pseudokineococcus sp.]|uniref:hypothetical protein n=1 Tax=uncultured Pseudokineococcus sp. TaxID=1642928 RepID=UPI002607C30B|nr:hypothetical protein [uncultured Pseudokineococcus sp.]
MDRPRRAALLAALAVLGVGGASSALPAVTGAGTADQAAVPAQLPGYSYRTGQLGAAPPDRVLAVYQQGFGVELLDFPQALVVGADGASARRLRTAMSRGAPDSQGDAAPMSVSPDGAAVAVGDWDAGAPSGELVVAAPEDADMALVDAATGDVRTVDLPDATAVLPLAWSPDSQRLAYVSPTGEVGPYGRSGRPGHLLVLDVGTGAAVPVAGVDDAVSAAFSPDGLLAVQRAGGAIEVRGPDGGLLRTVTPPRPEGVLTSGAGWSPDGRLLALQGEAAVSFLAASGDPAAAVPAPVAADGLLAWRSADEVLLEDVGASSTATSVDFTVSHADLSTGAVQPFTRVPTGSGNYAVHDFQMATGLAQHAEQVSGSPRADRGWPSPLVRAGAWLLAAGAAALVAGRLSRRRARSRAIGLAAAEPLPAGGSPAREQEAAAGSR